MHGMRRDLYDSCEEKNPSVRGNLPEGGTAELSAALTDSDIATSNLNRYEMYRDSVGGSDRVAFTYNRQRQVTSLTDQNGTVHRFDFDKLGRSTQDRITTLGSGVDGAVRRLARMLL